MSEPARALRIVILNTVFGVVAAISIAHGCYWGAKLRPQMVVNPPIECGPGYEEQEGLVIGPDANLIAGICQTIIAERGSLPKTRSEPFKCHSRSGGQIDKQLAA